MNALGPTLGPDDAPTLLPAVDVLLADGSTARVRPATPDDRAALGEFHGRLSLESSSLRYFGAHPRLTDADLDRITAGGSDHLSLVAERDGLIVAVAEYHRAVGRDEADVAFVVDDAFQGRGLGTILLEHLASEARRHGVRRFVADTLAGNARMLEVFHKVGFAAVKTSDSGVVHVVLDIAPSPASIEAAEARDRRAVVRSMQRLLRPRSVAVIGASPRPGTIGHALVHNLVVAGFQGPVFPVHPHAASVAGVPCWPSVTEVPGDVDLAIVAVPAASVPGVVAACGDKGVGALVVVSAGFADAGPEGAEAERRITRAAHGWGMRVVGPNCFGVLNSDPAVQLNATFAPECPRRGRVGFASQSGGLGIAILAEARARGLGLSSFVSMGNKADVSGNDLLAWWEEDPATDVALLYLESFGNPRKFARLARRIGRDKPIVAVKGGRARVGAGAGNAAASQAAEVAGSDRAVEALLRACGVVRVDTVEELFDVAEVLVSQPVPIGDRVGIVTNAGGPAVLAADACIRYGLTVPELSDATRAALREHSPGSRGVGNPVDLGTSATADAFRSAVEVVTRSGEVDGLVVIFTPPLVTDAEAVARGVVAGADAAATAGCRRPVVATFFGTEAGRSTLGAARAPIPCFTYPETAVRALAHAASYGRWRLRSTSSPPVLTGVDANAGRKGLAQRDDDGWVTGGAAMAVLEAFGIPTLATVEATTAEPTVVPRTAPVGVEVVVGSVQDPQFGPVVLFRLGGPAAELLGDHRVGLAPLGEAEAREMVLGARAAPLLTGYGGSDPVDVDGLIDVVLRMSRLAEDLPEVAEADCNRVVASPDGVRVVDARLRVTPGPLRPTDDRRHLR